MKQFTMLFSVLMVLFVSAFALPVVTNAQPYGSGMFSILKPEIYSSTEGEYYYISGYMTHAPTLDQGTDDIGVYDEQKRIFVEENDEYDRIHVQCAGETNFSLFTKKMKSADAVSLFELYDWYSSILERMDYYDDREFNNSFQPGGSLLTDTITSGTLYYGKNGYFKGTKLKITSGVIIVTYDMLYNELTMKLVDVMVKGVYDRMPVPFIVPRMEH